MSLCSISSNIEAGSQYDQVTPAEALRNGVHLSCLRLIEEGGTLEGLDLNAVDGDELGLFQSALINDFPIAALRLLQAGADHTIGLETYDVLGHASAEGYLDLVQYMVEELQMTPSLHDACHGGQTAVVEYLLSKGTVLNGLDRYGLPPVAYALMAGHNALAKELLRKTRWSMRIGSEGSFAPVSVDLKQTSMENLKGALALLEESFERKASLPNEEFINWSNEKLPYVKEHLDIGLSWLFHRFVRKDDLPMFAEHLKRLIEAKALYEIDQVGAHFGVMWALLT